MDDRHKKKNFVRGEHCEYTLFAALATLRYSEVDKDFTLAH